MVMSPASTALGLNSFRLASLHLLSLDLRVTRKGSPTVVNSLATRFVQHWKYSLALGTSSSASSSWLDLLSVHVRTGKTYPPVTEDCKTIHSTTKVLLNHITGMGR
jgi:uncharacterized protein YpbB